MRFLLKALVTALVVAGVSEVGKRSTYMAAILASLPLTSILAIIWLYGDTGDVAKVSELSHGIFLAVFPSLLFFLVLPFLLRKGFSFSLGLVLSSIIMVAFYWVYVFAVRKMGVKAI